MKINIKKTVLYLLENVPETREDDRVLYAYFVNRVYPEQIFNGRIALSFLCHVVSFESIRRVRQLIQASGQFLPQDPKTIAKRNRNKEKVEELVRNWYETNELEDKINHAADVAQTEVMCAVVQTSIPLNQKQ